MNAYTGQFVKVAFSEPHYFEGVWEVMGVYSTKLALCNVDTKQAITIDPRVVYEDAETHYRERKHRAARQAEIAHYNVVMTKRIAAGYMPHRRFSVGR